MSELFEVVPPETKPEQPSAEAKAEVPAVVQSQDDRLLEKVLDSGNIEVLERYIALRKSEQERQARIEFEKAFSAMHAEFPEIKKTRKGHNGMYAPLEEIQRAINPIVKKHGFAYWWTSEKTQDGILEYIVISYGGYSKMSPCYIPNIQATAAMNAVQAIGTMQSYGRRYSLIDGFGLTVVGEDNDGDVGRYEQIAAPYIERINASKTIDDLRKVYIEALAQTTGNKPVQGLIALAKDAKQKELRNGTKVS